MGSWNTGNFDNDSAADLLANQRDAWVNSIENALEYYQKPGVTPMEAEDDVMTYLEMIYRIAVFDRKLDHQIKQFLIPSIIPKRMQLEKWRAIVISKHLEYFGKKARRTERFKTICATFDALMEVSR